MGMVPFQVRFEKVVRTYNSHVLKTEFPAGLALARNAYPAPMTDFPRWNLSSVLMSNADRLEVLQFYNDTGGGADFFSWSPEGPGGSIIRDARFINSSLVIVARSRIHYAVSVSIELLRPHETADF